MKNEKELKNYAEYHRPGELMTETKQWLDEMTTEERLKTISETCIDWDGCRTAEALGDLVNEIWSYARYPIKKNEWISVDDERKPDEYEDVVVFCYFGGTIYRDLTFERISGKYVAQYVDGAFYVDGEEQTCVTHWMRLPKDPISKGGIDIDSI